MVSFSTAQQRRGKAAAAYNILHGYSSAQHYKINTSVTINNIPMCSPNNRNLKTDCI
jgi:hypothetical protein